MTNEKTHPEKMEITDALLGALRFEERVIGLNPDGSLRTVRTPAGMTDWKIRDTKLLGFVVRITRGGIRFYAQRKLGGKPCVFDCDRWSETNTLSKARKRADLALGMMRTGRDPNLERKKAVAEVVDARAKAKLTFGFALERDAKNMEDGDAPKTARDRKDVAKWLADLPIWRKPIHEVADADIGDMMKSVADKRGEPTALKVWRYARAAWVRMPAGDTPALNPFDEWKKAHRLPTVRRRQTSISTKDDDARAWLRAIAALRDIPGKNAFPRRVMADYIILALAWGARRGEASELRTSDVNLDKGFARFQDTKNGTDHVFPLTPGCAAIIRARIADNEAHREGDWVFPSRRRGLHIVEPQGALDVGEKASGVKVAMHDLRRSFAGAVGAEAVAGDDGKIRSGGLELLKVAMNHASAMSDVTIGYVMDEAKLMILRPIYESQERRVLEAASLSSLLPKIEPKITLRKDGDEYVAVIGDVEARAATAKDARALALEIASG